MAKSKTLHVDVVSAEEEIYSGEATFVAAPAELGEIGIPPGHAPLIARLRIGRVRIKNEKGEEKEPIFVKGGFIEVQPGLVTILADTAIRARDIDEAAALEAKRRAEELLRERAGEIEYSKAAAELAEAVEQLRTLEAYRKQKGRFER